jgi:hypothetical protein
MYGDDRRQRIRQQRVGLSENEAEIGVERCDARQSQ